MFIYLSLNIYSCVILDHTTLPGINPPSSASDWLHPACKVTLMHNSHQRSNRGEMSHSVAKMECSRTLAVSQFRVCLLWRTLPSWSLKASPSETLLTSSAAVKCVGLAFGAVPGCVTRCFTLMSRFLLPRPVKMTIYATRCRHFLS